MAAHRAVAVLLTVAAILSLPPQAGGAEPALTVGVSPPVLSLRLKPGDTGDMKFLVRQTGGQGTLRLTPTAVKIISGLERREVGTWARPVEIFPDPYRPVQVTVDVPKEVEDGLYTFHVVVEGSNGSTVAQVAARVFVEVGLAPPPNLTGLRFRLPWWSVHPLVRGTLTVLNGGPGVAHLEGQLSVRGLWGKDQHIPLSLPGAVSPEGQRTFPLELQLPSQMNFFRIDAHVWTDTGSRLAAHRWLILVPVSYLILAGLFVVQAFLLTWLFRRSPRAGSLRIQRGLHRSRP